MVAVSSRHQQNETGEAASPTVFSIASLSARVSAYLIDSLVLLGLVLVFLMLASLQLLLVDQRSSNDPPDSAYYAFTGILLGGTLIGWTLLSLLLLHSRSQTPGMYVLAIRVLDEDGERPRFSSLAVRWFCLHPLLFHPVLLIPWLFLVFVLAALSVNQALLALVAGISILCLVAPVVSALSLLVDPSHRTVNDRLSHTVVARLTPE